MIGTLNSAQSYIELKKYIKVFEETRNRVKENPDSFNVYFQSGRFDPNSIVAINTIMANERSRKNTQKEYEKLSAFVSLSNAITGNNSDDAQKIANLNDVDCSFYCFSKELGAITDKYKATGGKKFKSPESFSNTMLSEAQKSLIEKQEDVANARKNKKKAKNKLRGKRLLFLLSFIPALLMAGLGVGLGLWAASSLAVAATLPQAALMFLPSMGAFIVTNLIMRKVITKAANNVGKAKGEYIACKDELKKEKRAEKASYNEYATLYRFANEIMKGYYYESNFMAGDGERALKERTNNSNKSSESEIAQSKDFENYQSEPRREESYEAGNSQPATNLSEPINPRSGVEETSKHEIEEQVEPAKTTEPLSFGEVQDEGEQTEPTTQISEPEPQGDLELPEHKEPALTQEENEFKEPTSSAREDREPEPAQAKEPTFERGDESFSESDENSVQPKDFGLGGNASEQFSLPDENYTYQDYLKELSGKESRAESEELSDEALETVDNLFGKKKGIVSSSSEEIDNSADLDSSEEIKSFLNDYQNSIDGKPNQSEISEQDIIDEQNAKALNSLFGFNRNKQRTNQSHEEQIESTSLQTSEHGLTGSEPDVDRDAGVKKSVYNEVDLTDEEDLTDDYGDYGVSKTAVIERPAQTVSSRDLSGKRKIAIKDLLNSGTSERVSNQQETQFDDYVDESLEDELESQVEDEPRFSTSLRQEKGEEKIASGDLMQTETKPLPRPVNNKHKTVKDTTKIKKQEEEMARAIASSKLKIKGGNFTDEEIFESMNHALEDDYMGDFSEIVPADFMSLEQKVAGDYEEAREIKKRGANSGAEQEFVARAEYEKAICDYYGRFVPRTYTDGRIIKPVNPALNYTSNEQLSYDELKKKKSILTYKQKAFKALVELGQISLKNQGADEEVIFEGLQNFNTQIELIKTRTQNVEEEIETRNKAIMNNVVSEISNAMSSKSKTVKFNAKEKKIAEETAQELLHATLKEYGKKKYLQKSKSEERERLESTIEYLQDGNAKIEAYGLFKQLNYKTADELEYALIMGDANSRTLENLEVLFKSKGEGNTPKSKVVNRQLSMTEHFEVYQEAKVKGENLETSLRDLENRLANANNASERENLAKEVEETKAKIAEISEIEGTVKDEIYIQMKTILNYQGKNVARCLNNKNAETLGENANIEEASDLVDNIHKVEVMGDKEFRARGIDIFEAFEDVKDKSRQIDDLLKSANKKQSEEEIENYELSAEQRAQLYARFKSMTLKPKKAEQTNASSVLNDEEEEEMSK